MIVLFYSACICHMEQHGFKFLQLLPANWCLPAGLTATVLVAWNHVWQMCMKHSVHLRGPLLEFESSRRHPDLTL